MSSSLAGKVDTSTPDTTPCAGKTQQINPMVIGLSESLDSLASFNLENQVSDELIPAMQRIVLDEFAPKSVIIDQEGQVLCASADMDKYLAVTGGKFENNIVKLARQGLTIGLRSALAEANEFKQRVVYEDLYVLVDDAFQRVKLTIQPMPQSGVDDELMMVVFQDIGEPFIRTTVDENSAVDVESSAAKNPLTAESAERQADKIIEHLERELETTRNKLERSIHEMAVTNDEQKRSNEELIATNEQLQSANEQLATSREEVQDAIEAVAKSKDDLENLLRSSQIATIFLDDDYNICGFTPAVNQIYGIIDTDIGRPLSQFKPMTDEMPDLPAWGEINNEEPVEDTLQTNSGKSFIRRVLPYLDRNGDRNGIVVTFSDVTELRASEKLLTRSLQAARMGAWEWRPAESFWTPELFELMEISPTETPSLETFYQHIHPDDVESFKTAWEKSAAGNDSYDHEFRVVRNDGEVRWIVGTGEVELNKHGTVQRVYGLYWDNTPAHLAADALKDSERRAMTANQSKSEFLANMSHEIRTPMSAIIGYADILDRHLSDPDDLNCVSIIRDNGKFLLEIINDILDISKIEAGKLEMSLNIIRLDQLVADVRSLMQVRAVEKNIDFTVEIDGEVPQEIKSNSKRLKQILINLIGNAIKFTESGSVKLVVRYLDQNAPQIQFEVADTGIGMTAEQQSGLFQSFSQADASVARRFGGTGLGLAISQRLAGMLGGEISVESEPGEGSIFSLRVAAGRVNSIGKINIEDWEVDAKKSPSREISNIKLVGKFLVVDDRREIRFIAQHFIEEAGGRVVTSENGQEAIDAIEFADSVRRPFDVVIMDMQMPILDGYETTRRLRKTGYEKPIIALTAHTMEGDREKCLNAGCTDYIPKPVNGPAFIKLLKDYLDREKCVPQTLQRKILVVEDSEDAREAISMLLTLNGHSVEGTADGESGIEVAKSFEPEVVLLDLGLPDMSGFEAFERLRKIPALSATKFVAATGQSNFDETCAAGFHHHIVKPIDLEALEEWIMKS